MSKDSAVLPERSVHQVIMDLKRSNEPPKQGLDGRDEKLAELAGMPGWKVLKEYIEARIREIGQMVSGKLGEDSLEAIGLKAILAELTRDELKAIITRVDRAKEVVEEDDK